MWLYIIFTGGLNLKVLTHLINVSTLWFIHLLVYSLIHNLPLGYPAYIQIEFAVGKDFLYLTRK